MSLSETNIPEISVERLRQKVAAGEAVYLLDVRTPYEFENERLEFTTDLIPYNLLAKHLARLPGDKSTPVYLFCRAGRRSGIATEYLRSIGYGEAYNVVGGILAWKAAGFETVSGGDGLPLFRFD